MAYRSRRGSRSPGRRSSTYGRRRRTTRRPRVRRSGTQRIVIQVMGPSAGMVPVTGSIAQTKGSRPVRRMF